MKYIEKLIKAAVKEIESPFSTDPHGDIKQALAAQMPEEQFREARDAAFELIKIIGGASGKTASCESVISYLKAADFVLARNLMLFGLITAFAFFTLRFCSPENIIYALYGATAFYIFLIVLAPQKIKKYRLLKSVAIRQYRESLIDFSCALIKKHSLDPSAFAINLKGDHIFMNLNARDGVYYFKTV
ncbi:MAG: hypothetical protein BWY32_00997 [bacterium ADurb.Bin243]|nr:MAG: hypothetical protein BWY32_00997 [bacterium ADurb.Bin243]HOD39739.1 hypothetical protein [Candidatus Wallbacteria bacterium]